MEFRPAALCDYTTLFPAAPAVLWKGAAVQILGGPAWTLWAKGAPLLICGLWPFAPAVLEAWLMTPPNAPRPGLAVLRYLTRRAGAAFPDHILITRVDDANMAGRKLAILAGFEPLDEFLAGTSIRTWLRRSAIPID